MNLISAGRLLYSCNSLLDGVFRRSHGTTPGRSGRAAAALRAIFCTTWLRAVKGTRFLAALLAAVFATGFFTTARLRTTLSTGRAGTTCHFGLCPHHLRAGCRLGCHWAACHFTLASFYRGIVLGSITVGITAEQNRTGQ